MRLAQEHVMRPTLIRHTVMNKYVLNKKSVTYLITCSFIIRV